MAPLLADSRKYEKINQRIKTSAHWGDRRCQLYRIGLPGVHGMLSMTSEHMKARITDLVIDDEES